MALPSQLFCVPATAILLHAHAHEFDFCPHGLTCYVQLASKYDGAIETIHMLMQTRTLHANDMCSRRQ